MKEIESLSPHVCIEEYGYAPEIPLCWSIDFNVSPMTSLVIQNRVGALGAFVVLDEISLYAAETRTMCSVFLSRKWRFPVNKLQIYGCRYGNFVDNMTATSDWAVIQDALREHLAPGCIKIPEISHWMHIDLMGPTFKSRLERHKIKFIVDPACKNLIRGLSVYSVDDRAAMHAVYALCHFLDYEYPPE